MPGKHQSAMFLKLFTVYLWLEVVWHAQGFEFLTVLLFEEASCVTAAGSQNYLPKDVCMRSQLDTTKYQKVTGCSLTHVLVDLYTDSACTNLHLTGQNLYARDFCHTDPNYGYIKISCTVVDYVNYVYEERFTDSACTSFSAPAFLVTDICFDYYSATSSAKKIKYTCTGGPHTLTTKYYPGGANPECTLVESTATHTGGPCQQPAGLSWYSTRTGCGVTAFIPSAAVGTDPVARYGDRAVEFELPPDVLTPLISTDDLMIAGSVFSGGGPWESWFNRIVLSPLPENDRFLEIKIKENLHELNYSRFPRNSLRTLDVHVKIGNLSNPTFVEQLTGKGQEISTPLLGYHVIFRTVDRRAALSFPTIGNFPSECAEVAGPNLHFVICSVPASEYYGPQRDFSMKYAHLDMAFWELRDTSSLSGLFPEMWGMHPMSDSTKAYLKKTTIGKNELVL